MQARYFRYLFDNAEDGVLQSGCIWDRYTDERTIYLYIAGATSVRKIYGENRWRKLASGGVIDILIVGAITVNYVNLITSIIQEYFIKTIVLPYLTPVQRLYLAKLLVKMGDDNKNVMEFLRDPYSYLRKNRVENIHILYGNGKNIDADIDSLVAGENFEDISEREKLIIEKLEGKNIPVEKAGYIITNKWLFYFGNYGQDIYKTIELISDNVKIEENRKYVGTGQEVTATLFLAPLYSVPREIDSLFTGKNFRRCQDCQVDIASQVNRCELRCIYQNDYAILKKHKAFENEESKFGLMLLGNVNLNLYIDNIKSRYSMIRNRIRVISVPNCGIARNWNSKILDIFMGNELKYLMCNVQLYTSDKVLRDIIVKSGDHRLINVNMEYGYCFSGFLVYNTENAE